MLRRPTRQRRIIGVQICATECLLPDLRATPGFPARVATPKQVVRVEVMLLNQEGPVRPITLQQEDLVEGTPLSCQGPVRLIPLQQEGQVEATTLKPESQSDPPIPSPRGWIDHTLTPLHPDHQHQPNLYTLSRQAAVGPLSTTTDADWMLGVRLRFLEEKLRSKIAAESLLYLWKVVCPRIAFWTCLG